MTNARKSLAEIFNLDGEDIHRISTNEVESLIALMGDREFIRWLPTFPRELLPLAANIFASRNRGDMVRHIASQANQPSTPPPSN